MSGTRAFAFGSFQLFPERQLLMRGNSAIRIGCRALDLLTALVERPGKLITKAELMAHAWPTTRVDESNLKVNMAALRRVLDDDAGAARFIATVTGRGYRFIAPLEERLADSSGAGLMGDHAGGERDEAYGNREQGASLRFMDLPPIEGSAGIAGEGVGLPIGVDYGIVIDGEIMLHIHGAPVLLKPGSLVVRSGAGQSWVNRSGKPVRILLVQVDAM